MRKDFFLKSIFISYMKIKIDSYKKCNHLEFRQKNVIC